MDPHTVPGPHIDPPLRQIPGILEAHGWHVFQTVLRDPMRLSKTGVPDVSDQTDFQTGAESVNALWGIAHASLITNLASPDPRIRHGSAGALVADANLATTLGMSGVCFHAGYQKGHATAQIALDVVVQTIQGLLPRLAPGARLLLENGCEGTELCQTIAELGQVIRAVGDSPTRIGIVLDTCHLHVAGFDMSAPEAPDRLAEEITAAGLEPYLAALHLNDAQAPCGSHRDRHAPPGQGTIGQGLRALRRHPLFAPLPAILEMSLPQAEQGIAYLLEDA